MESTALLAAIAMPIIIMAGLIYALRMSVQAIRRMPKANDTIEGIAASCLFAVLWSIIFLNKSSYNPYYGPILWLLFVVLAGVMIEVPKSSSLRDIIFCAVPCAVTLLVSTIIIAIILETQQISDEVNGLSTAIGAPIAIFKGAKLSPPKSITPLNIAPIVFMLALTSACAVPGTTVAILARKRLISILNTTPRNLSRINQLVTRLIQLIAVTGSLIYALTTG